MINMNLTIVIPVFWTKTEEIETKSSELGNISARTFDKPGSLAKVLESLKILSRNDYTLLVISAADSPDLEEEAEIFTGKIIRKHYSGKNPLLFSHSHLRRILEKFSDEEKTRFADILNLNNYSGARNMGLVLSNLLGSDIAIMLEDDKIIEDPDFLEKAENLIGKEIEGRSVFGKGGPYLQKNNDYHIPVSRETRQSDIFWCKNTKLNEALKAFVGNKERITESPMVFGGNMTIAREMFMEIPFDPNCISGEDEDYLINARMLGFAFFMDSEMTVKQLSPETHPPRWWSMRNDILHFLFDRKKLQLSQSNQFLHPITSEEMNPYPGFFLGEDLNERIMNASISLFQEYLEEGEQNSGVEATRNIKIATEYENSLENPAMEYFRIHRKWTKMMKRLNDEKENFSGILEACSLYSYSTK